MSEPETPPPELPAAVRAAFRLGGLDALLAFLGSGIEAGRVYCCPECDGARDIIVRVSELTGGGTVTEKTGCPLCVLFGRVQVFESEPVHGIDVVSAKALYPGAHHRGSR